MDAEEKSIEFAQEQTKQFISLATAIPAVMITFAKDFVSQVPPEVKTWAFLSWGFFLASVFFGLLALMAFTGALDRRASRQGGAVTPSTSPVEGRMTPEPDRLLSRNARLFAGIQIVAFFLGLVLVVVFGWNSA